MAKLTKVSTENNAPRSGLAKVPSTDGNQAETTNKPRPSEHLAETGTAAPAASFPPSGQSRPAPSPKPTGTGPSGPADGLRAKPAPARQPADQQAEPDPFDPASLRLSQDFAADLGVKKVLTTVPVRKPDKTWWVRVHPAEDYRLPTVVIELKEERETYLVGPALRAELATEATLSPRTIFTGVNRQGTVFLWPVRLPGPDGKIDDWSRSALEAAQRAMTTWVRVTANMNLGAYDISEATGPLPDPSSASTRSRTCCGSASGTGTSTVRTTRF
jgi:hypothetical protein